MPNVVFHELPEDEQKRIMSNIAQGPGHFAPPATAGYFTESAAILSTRGHMINRGGFSIVTILNEQKQHEILVRADATTRSPVYPMTPVMGGAAGRGEDTQSAAKRETLEETLGVIDLQGVPEISGPAVDTQRHPNAFQLNNCWYRDYYTYQVQTLASIEQRTQAEMVMTLIAQQMLGLRNDLIQGVMEITGAERIESLWDVKLTADQWQILKAQMNPKIEQLKEFFSSHSEYATDIISASLDTMQSSSDYKTFLKTLEQHTESSAFKFISVDSLFILLQAYRELCDDVSYQKIESDIRRVTTELATAKNTVKELKAAIQEGRSTAEELEIATNIVASKKQELQQHQSSESERLKEFVLHCASKVTPDIDFLLSDKASELNAQFAGKLPYRLWPVTVNIATRITRLVPLLLMLAKLPPEHDLVRKFVALQAEQKDNSAMVAQQSFCDTQSSSSGVGFFRSHSMEEKPEAVIPDNVTSATM